MQSSPRFAGAAFRNGKGRDIVGGNLKPKPETAAMGEVVTYAVRSPLRTMN